MSSFKKNIKHEILGLHDTKLILSTIAILHTKVLQVCMLKSQNKLNFIHDRSKLFVISNTLLGF